MKAPSLVPKGPSLGTGKPSSTNTGAKYSQPRLRTIKRMLTKPVGSGSMKIKPFGI